MATKYSAKQINALYDQIREIQDDICHHFAGVIYNGSTMYTLRQNIKSVNAYAQHIRDLRGAGKGFLDENEDLAGMLPFMEKIQKRVRSYHKKNIKKDTLKIAERTAVAQENCTEVMDRWLPQLTAAVSRRAWAGASMLMLDMPYEINKYRDEVSCGAIRDKALIGTFKELDKKLSQALNKIPLKIYNKLVMSRQQRKMEGQRAKVLNWLDDFRNKVQAKDAFAVDNYSSYDFSARAIQRLESELRIGDRICADARKLEQLPQKQLPTERE